MIDQRRRQDDARLLMCYGLPEPSAPLPVLAGAGALAALQTLTRQGAADPSRFYKTGGST